MAILTTLAKGRGVSASYVTFSSPFIAIYKEVVSGLFAKCVRIFFGFAIRKLNNKKSMPIKITPYIIRRFFVYVFLSNKINKTSMMINPRSNGTLNNKTAIRNRAIIVPFLINRLIASLVRVDSLNSGNAERKMIPITPIHAYTFKRKNLLILLWPIIT